MSRNTLRPLRRKVDANHAAIVQALRDEGCAVQSLAAIGKGCPDLMWSRNGVTGVMEVKDGSKPPSARRLTAQQLEWRALWQGAYHVVENVHDAVSIVCLARRRP